MFLLVGCSEANTESEQTSSVVDESSETNAEDNEMRTYTDVTGREVEIPVHPERVVTTQYVDAMITLGVEPIGAPSHVLDREYLSGITDDVEDLGFPFSVEKVVELAPDLIITADPEEVEQLSMIAPTVVVPWMYGDFFTQLEEVASILGKEKEAEKWAAEFEDKLSEVKEEVAGVFGEDETVSIFMAAGNDNLRLYGGRNIGHIFYRSLELTPPPYIQERIEEDPEFQEFVFDDVSMEMLPEYAGDHIVMLVYDQEARDEGGMYSQIEQSPLWQNLDAVKNDQVYYVNEEPWFVYTSLAIEKSLEEVSEIVVK
ncbi:ABC transporter substrate-binding protein [Alkalicoccobacillus murimartini]|uniref:ABC transporter substrate-binding protein n=1 Tax=Alkalicoccobacillus murimartini TaxID=171685 RepID=UPI0027D8BC91|nr:ABC transporter substrate-binding protein [Alkalicoccobacillus murimartini]